MTRGQPLGLYNSEEPEGLTGSSSAGHLGMGITESFHFCSANKSAALLTTEKEMKTHHGP